MTLPSSTIKKKHNAIAYHPVSEVVAAGILNDKVMGRITSQIYLPGNIWYYVLETCEVRANDIVSTGAILFKGSIIAYTAYVNNMNLSTDPGTYLTTHPLYIPE